MRRSTSVRRAILGDPLSSGADLGPVANAAHCGRVQALIQAGIEAGAKLVAGGLGRPEGLSRGFYVKPTVSCEEDVRMAIALQEILVRCCRS